MVAYICNSSTRLACANRRVSKKIKISRLAWATVSKEKIQPPPSDLQGKLEVSRLGSVKGFGLVRVGNVGFCTLCTGVVTLGDIG